jgi:hypothetical protein
LAARRKRGQHELQQNQARQDEQHVRRRPRVTTAITERKNS